MSAVLGKPPAAASSRLGCVIAIVQTAGRRIGIDGEHVVQAVVVPSAMTAMPRRGGGIAGVMAHGGQLVPVVRLDEWLDGSDAGAPEPDDAPPLPGDARVVVLRDGDQVIGLRVDAVIGMVRCQAGAIARLFHDEQPEELFARAVLVDAARPALALLEPRRLAALARVWAAAAPATQAELDAARQDDDAVVGEAASAAAPRARLGVFRIGDRLVGIAADDIGELLRPPALRAPPVRGRASRGLCDWRGRLLPVVDLAADLGTLADASAPAWMCVVRHGERLLGVLVHELVELHAPVDDGAAQAAGALVRAELSTPRGVLQVIDTAALMAHCPESVISERREPATTPRQRLETSPHPWLVFDAAGEYAARIQGVQEVVPLPDDLRPRLEAGLPASLPWRGHAVPVRALFADGGRLSIDAARQLMVVEVGERRVAIPIAGVKAMIAAGTASLARMRVGPRSVDVVSTPGASYEAVDLEARALQG